MPQGTFSLIVAITRTPDAKLNPQCAFAVTASPEAFSTPTWHSSS